MKILFIIPARKGSKRLIGKNKRIFNGKPLVCHSIDFAISIASNEDYICITSDDDEILDIAKKKAINLIVKRPAILASDEATSFDVIIHACAYALESKTNFDTVVLLQPTTPFRSVEDFRVMKKIFIEEKMSSLASISINGDAKNSVIYDPNSMKRCRDILGKKGYLNGSIYFFSYHRLLEQNRTLDFYDMFYYLMSTKNSIDIDTIDDWNKAIKLL